MLYKPFTKIIFFGLVILLAFISFSNASLYRFSGGPGKINYGEEEGFIMPGDNTKPVLLPSSFINGERFYLKLQSASGDTLLGFCDTGGGISMAFPSAIDKGGVSKQVKRGAMRGIMPMKYIYFKDIVKDPGIPAPVVLQSMPIKRHGKAVTDPFIMVPPMKGEMKFFTEILSCDMFLAQNFFMGKAWIFDYIHRQVWVNTPLKAEELGQPGVQKIGFKTNSEGEKIYGHPSMVIEVDGQKIDVLFDAGATIIVSDSGHKMLNTNEKTIGGSFIATSVFDQWRKDHPDWKYYPKADRNQDIIEVPKVKIGGIEAGPVLFACRPDEAWSKNMIATMDKVVKGAVGGSALKYYKVTIDYNSSLIKFE